MTAAERLDARITGRVQGVGFRYFVQRRAEGLGLVGWVRNRPDGSVEVCAEGSKAELEALLDHLRQGPPAARVEGVQTRWGDAEGSFDRFDIRRS